MTGSGVFSPDAADKTSATSSNELPESAPLAASVEAEVGRRLVSARMAKKLSVTDIAMRLRLREKQIGALETGDIDALPGKTFVRGFVRNYANAVGIDPLPLLSLLEQSTRLALPPMDFPQPGHVAMPDRSQKEAWNDRLAVSVGFVVLLAVIAAVFVSFVWNSRDGAPASQALLDETAMPALPQAPQSIESSPADVAGTSNEAASSATASGTVTPVLSKVGEALRLEFTSDSWVQIVDANQQVIHDQIHEADTVQAIMVQPPVEVVIGKASGVRFFHQGKALVLRPNSKNVATVKLP
jgi:cytoskeleton protein RodZ